MSEQLNRKQVIANIKAAAKAAKIDEANLPVTWYDKIREEIPVIPTPSAELNECLGPGGIAQGRVYEFFGPEAGGKTTLAAQVCAEAQRLDMHCAYIDMEHTLDPVYLQNLGVDMEKLMISQPSNGTDAIKLLKVLIQSGVGLVIIDSVAALSTVEELEKEITDANVSLAARMMSQALRQVQPMAHINNCTLIFINQLREKIGGYGSPETTPGGRALKHYAAGRLRIARTEIKKVGGEPARQISKIRVVKNKVGIPFKECEVDIIFGRGIDRIADMIRVAKKRDVIKGTSRMTLPQLGCDGLKGHEGELKFVGTDAVIEFIESCDGYADALMQKLSKPGLQEVKNV
jgi:recombination protein RecA